MTLFLAWISTPRAQKEPYSPQSINLLERNNQHIDRKSSSICQPRVNSSFMQDQASGEDQFLWPTIFPTSMPSWSTRYDCGIQPLTPYWSIVFSFKSKTTGRVILFRSMNFWAALFLSPSMATKMKTGLSLFP